MARLLLIGSVLLLLVMAVPSRPALAQETGPVDEAVEVLETPKPYVITVNAPTEEPRGLSLAEPVAFVSVFADVEGETKGLSLLDRAELDVQTVWTQIVKRQYQYKDMTGGKGYFQGLPTSSETPKDGALVAMDRWFDTPADQSFGWDDIKILPYTELPFTVRIDVYDGPQGIGFVGVFELVVDGKLYRRSLNEGPETWMEEPWRAAE